MCHRVSHGVWSMLGFNEIMVVLVLALVVLGPERVIQMIHSLRRETEGLRQEIMRDEVAEEEDDEPGFVHHLEELRRRLIISVVSIIPFAGLAFPFAPRIIQFFRHPYGGNLIFIAPTEAFVVNIKVAIATGVACAFPVIAYQMWRFIAPGLYPREKKVFLTLFLTSIFLFAGGMAFAYFGILPLAFRFLLQFSAPWFQPMLTAGKYFSFVFKLMIAFGLAFQLPIVIFFLVVADIVSLETFSSYRRAIWVVSFIVGAVLTPPDVLSQVMMSLPLIILFEASLLVSRLYLRARGR